MLRKVLTRLTVWVSALGLAPLALGTGIPVVDALLNSTAVVQLHQQITTATQNVAQTLKQRAASSGAPRWPRRVSEWA